MCYTLIVNANRKGRCQLIAGILQCNHKNLFSKSYATASLALYKDTPILVTAGHNVFDPIKNEFEDTILFKCGDKKLIVKEIAVHDLWATHQGLEYDFSFGLLENNPFPLNQITSRIIPYTFQIKHGELLGYYKSLFSKKTAKYEGPIIGDKYFNSKLLGLKIKSHSGMSGGPWFIRKKNIENIFAVTSLEMRQLPTVSWGAPFGEEAFVLLDSLLTNSDSQSMRKKKY